jgi:hypothetical protein
MKINRIWAMPNKWTFSIKPIKELVYSYVCEPGKEWIDPFVGHSPFREYMWLTNDLYAETLADCHLESLDFLALLPDQSVDGVLFDPPFSPRQISESYKGVGRHVYSRDTTDIFWSERKRSVARVTKLGGIVISCGWNSGGIGKTLGFDLLEILLVPHGGHHNDTIVTVERRIRC